MMMGMMKKVEMITNQKANMMIVKKVINTLKQVTIKKQKKIKPVKKSTVQRRVVTVMSNLKCKIR
jgi:hypothetical protein